MSTSTPIGMIWRDIQRAQRLSDLNFKKDIVSTTQLAQIELAHRFDWEGLRRTVSVTYDGVNPCVLPADMVGILAVVDSDMAPVMRSEVWTDGLRENGAFVEGAPKRYWTVPYSHEDGMLSGDGLSIDEGAAFFTGPTLTDTMNGEFIQFGGEPGKYQILDGSEKTLYSKYWGPKQQNCQWTIRPTGTQTIIFTDAGTYRVDYWAEEKPLYKDNQMTVLPARAFGLLVMIHILGFHEKQETAADNYRREFERALSEAMHMNGRYYPPAQTAPGSGISPGANSGYGVSFGRKYR